MPVVTRHGLYFCGKIKDLHGYLVSLCNQYTTVHEVIKGSLN